MNRIFYAPEAQADLFEIRKYIIEELENPTAADNTLSKVTKRIRMLEQHSGVGSPLSSVVAIDTDYRFLVCGNYLVFYYVDGTYVYVVRVLYGRRDYLKILFGDLPEE